MFIGQCRQQGAAHFAKHPKPCKLLHALLQDAGPPIGLVSPFCFATFIHWEWLISTCGACHLATDVLDLTEGAGAHERFAVLWCNVNTAHPRGWSTCIGSSVTSTSADLASGRPVLVPSIGSSLASSRAVSWTFLDFGDEVASAPVQLLGSRLLSARDQSTFPSSEMLTRNWGGMRSEHKIPSISVRLKMTPNLCSLIVIVWFLKMIVSFWLKKCSFFLLFHFGMVFQHVSFHFLGISFHAKIETWRGGGSSEQKNML